jgi:guanylate kinase
MFFENPRLVAVSGVSGTGKTTLIENLVGKFPDCRIITYTTRPKRTNESLDDYHFCHLRMLQELPDKLWVHENYGHHYAVTRSSIETLLNQHGIALLPTTTSHHSELRTIFTKVRYVGIHLLAPARQELYDRMQKRGDETSSIEHRLMEIERIDQKAIDDVGLYKIKPNQPAKVLEEVLSLLKTS